MILSIQGVLAASTISTYPYIIISKYQSPRLKNSENPPKSVRDHAAFIALQDTAKRLNRKAEDADPYLSLLENNWYDTVDSLK